MRATLVCASTRIPVPSRMDYIVPLILLLVLLFLGTHLPMCALYDILWAASASDSAHEDQPYEQNALVQCRCCIEEQMARLAESCLCMCVCSCEQSASGQTFLPSHKERGRDREKWNRT